MYLKNISNSRRDTWKQCKLKYKYKYVKYLEGFDKGNTDALRFGSFIHRVLELGVEAKDLETLQRIAKEHKPNYKFATSYDSKIDLCLRNFLRFNAKLSEVGLVEASFENDLGDEINSTGIIDRVVKGLKGGLLIIDYKTGKREKSQFELYNDSQGPTYVDAIHKQTGVPYDKITFAHYYPLTNHFVNVTYPKAAIIKNRKNIINDAWKIRKCKEHQLLPMENQYCSWCEYRSGCSLFSPPSLVESSLRHSKRSKRPDQKKPTK